MTDLSPMERAIRALTAKGKQRHTVLGVLRDVADLRTSDPDAFAAVLAECGVERATVHKGCACLQPHDCEKDDCEEVWRG